MKPADAASQAQPSAFAPKAPLEELVFESPSIGIGTFACGVDHPLFRDSGASSTHCFVFPRTSVSIQHADEQPFLADPRVVTFYNAGQEYSRRAVSPEGDRADWFAVLPEIADEIVGSVVPRRPRRRKVFPFSHGPSSPSQYLEQRRLFERVRRQPVPEPLEVEETAFYLLASLVAAAIGAPPAAAVARTRRHTELVEQAKFQLAQAPAERLHLGQLANALGCSVFHLCRVFKQIEGTTIHAYRLDVRLRLALEPMSGKVADLTRIALDLGFCSHSHFTAAFRRHFGLRPSEFSSLFRYQAVSEDHVAKVRAHE